MSDDEERENHTVTEDGDTTATKTTNDDRLFAMLIYLTGIITNFFGPLLIWLLKRDESEYVDFHGKEFLNFFISYTIYGLASGFIILFGFILSFIPFIGFLIIGVAILAASLIGVAGLVLMIVAAVKAYNGELYRIPLVFRLIK